MTDPASIGLLRQHLRDRDAENAYALGLELLAVEPANEFASYAAAWGAAKTGKPAEIPRLIDAAVAANPENFNYRSLRGQAYIELECFIEALVDFEIMARLRPELPRVWKGLRQIYAALQLQQRLPRNLTIVAAEMADAYRARQWPRCGELVAELRTLEPLIARYWELRVDDFRVCLSNSIDEWQLFHEQCRSAVVADGENPGPVMPVLARRELPAKALLSIIDHLIKAGDLPGVLAQVRNLRAWYDKPCPLTAVPGICGLLIRDQRYADCVAFLDELDTDLSENDKATFRLRAFPYRWVCCEAPPTEDRLAVAEGAANPLSAELMVALQRAFDAGSPQALVTSACGSCWDAIAASGGMVLLDLRYSIRQTETMRSLILDALIRKAPFSLIRIGDGDCYGFRPDETDVLSSTMANYWWGKAATAPVRARLVAGFLETLRDADVIGLPGPIRLARDLNACNGAALTALREGGYRTLYTAVQELLARGELRPAWWVDEYCNFILADRDWLGVLMDAATVVVIVSCFEIPKGHLFDQPKVRPVLIPPHARVTAVATQKFNGTTLPEVLDDVQREVAGLAGPGVLLLVSAGFGGKSLVNCGRQRGAVAIDFGSGIDLLLGHMTRAVDCIPSYRL